MSVFDCAGKCYIIEKTKKAESDRYPEKYNYIYTF